jgi:hypothetical protein
MGQQQEVAEELSSEEKRADSKGSIPLQILRNYWDIGLKHRAL